MPNGTILELRAGKNPSLVLVQGENRLRVGLINVKGLVAALNDATDLAEVLAAGGVYNACPADRPGRTEDADPHSVLAEARPLAHAKERAASL